MAGDTNKTDATAIGSVDTPPPTAKTTTKESEPNAPVEAKEVKVPRPRNVTYQFVFEAKEVVRLRYAYQISKGGKFSGTQGSKPAAGAKLPSLSGNATKTMTVPPGESVRLFLNSDALAAFRMRPVYEVKPDGRDVIVKITEKTGTDAPANPALTGPETITIEEKSAGKATGKGKAAESTKKTRELDQYTGELNGALWMHVTHKYTEDDARQLLVEAKEPLEAPVSEAVLSAYSGKRLEGAKGVLKTPERESLLPITMGFLGYHPDTGEPDRKSASDVDSNCKQNIDGWKFFEEGLPRVHPWAILAMFIAAHRSGVRYMAVSSAWRPIFGSIVHRTGCGLDVTSIKGGKGVTANFRRQVVMDAFNANLDLWDRLESQIDKCQEPIRLRSDLKEMEKREREREKEMKEREKEMKEREKEMKKKEKGGKDAPSELTAAQAALTAAQAALKDAKAALKDAKAALKNAQERLYDWARRMEDLIRSEDPKASESEALRHFIGKGKPFVGRWIVASEAEREIVEKFSSELIQLKELVGQVITPYTIESTKDSLEPVANTASDRLQIAHLNHLHVTANVPSLVD